VNLQELKEKHPDVYAAAIAEGKTAGIAEGVSQGKTVGLTEGQAQGAAAERKRIADVKAQLIPGHEALIDSLIADGKTTGEQAAIQIVAAEKQVAAGRLAALKKDGDLGVLQPGAPEPGTEAALAAAADAKLPVEERTKKAWDATPALRAEFGAYENYLAFEKNADRIKILGRK